ncbi:TPA: hypothetical protein OUD84_000862 [Staphylococcus aureus]|nr:hypothetical protein [Staphylococcus aureus]
MIELNAITTLCLACILYLLGKAIVNHVNFLKRICIPAPVIGGLIFAILVAALDSFGMVKIKLDASFIQDLGIDSALTAALAAATLGLVFGGLIGGPVVKFLIKRYNLKPQHSDDTFKDYSQVAYNEHLHSKFNATEVFFIQFTIVVFCMAVGSYFSHLFTAQTEINVPIYVGSLFVAVIVRNISESFNFNIVDLKITNQIGDVALGIFLSLALMSIQLIEIYKLAIPLIIIVLVQVVVMILFAVLILFRGLGKDYDAAVMVGGFIGHGLGATPNAMANLDVITKKYGNSPKAYLVVPIVGAFLIDLIGVIVIMGFIQWFS